MANPAHNAPQNKIFLATTHNHAPPKKIFFSKGAPPCSGLLLLLLLPGGLLVARGGLLGAGEGGGGRLRGSRKAQSQKLGTHRSQNIYFHTLPHVTHPKIK